MSRRLITSTNQRIRKEIGTTSGIEVKAVRLNGIITCEFTTLEDISTTTTHLAVLSKNFRPKNIQRFVIDSDATNIIKVALNSGGDFIVSVVGTATLSANSVINFSYLAD